MLENAKLRKAHLDVHEDDEAEDEVLLSATELNQVAQSTVRMCRPRRRVVVSAPHHIALALQSVPTPLPT
jgi:hypothetical protein